MLAIVPADVNKCEWPVQEAAYHKLSELHLRKCFPGVCFASTNIPEERTKVLKY